MSEFNENNVQSTEEASSSVISETFPANDMNAYDAYSAETVGGAEAAKKKPIGVIIGVAAAVVIGGSAAAYGFVPAVKNTVNMAVMSDDKYYQWVEEENMGEMAEVVSEAYGVMCEQMDADTEEQIEVKFELDSANITSLIESASGTSLSETGITLPSDVTINGAAKRNDGNIDGVYTIGANGETIATANMIVKDGAYYYQIPELSEDYIKMDLAGMMDEAVAEAETAESAAVSDALMDIMSGEGNYEDILSDEELEALITTYSGIVFENIEGVKLEKKVECEVGSSKEKYTQLTAELDEGTLYGIASDVLDEAENDKVLKRAAEELGICTADEYAAAIADAKESLGGFEDVKGGDVVATMEVYVDGSGTIKGRTFKTVEEEANISYMTAGDNAEDFNITMNMDGDTVVVNGDFEEKGDKVSGKADFSISGSEELSFAILLEDYELVDEEKGYCKGTMTIDLTSMGVGQFTLALDSDGKGQSVACDIAYDGTTYGKLSVSSSEKVSMELPKFDESKKVYNFTETGEELEEYMANANLEAVLNKVGEVLGLEDLDLGHLLYGFEDDGYVADETVDDSYVEDEELVYEDEDFAIDDYDEEYSEEELGYEDVYVSYNLADLDIKLNGTTVTFPSVINGISNYVTFGEETLEAGGYTYATSDDYTCSVSIENGSTEALPPDECTVTSITVWEGSQLELMIDGIGIGSSLDEVLTKYGCTVENRDYGYITLEDTTDSWDVVSFSYMDGVIDGVAVSMY